MYASTTALVDEVNDSYSGPNPPPWKGVVWNFTLPDFAVLEDYESYADGQIGGPGEPWFPSCRKIATEGFMCILRLSPLA